ncbi:Uncharacterized protein APZ42_002904 [Daphnia magna]|uniref:Uncharacterized protein n=1 Tax=Daphnia magna TaxID=35525 RepID=A0A164HYR7_9CRUS|nr:Uncharacterized protein APZ42_002904 [Daphnia magna]
MKGNGELKNTLHCQTDKFEQIFQNIFVFSDNLVFPCVQCTCPPMIYLYILDVLVTFR